LDFPEDSAALTPESVKTLQELGAFMSSELASDEAFLIEAFTAIDPSRKNYLLRLSEERVAVVQRYLHSQFGLEVDQTIGFGMGSTNPYDPDHPSMSLNSRIEIRAYAGSDSRDRVRAFSKFRNPTRAFLPDFSFSNNRNADLRRADLAGLNLVESDFSGADLRDSDVTQSNLFRANLSNANLVGVNFSQSSLFAANLELANLSNANLKGAEIDQANLSRSTLLGTNLDGAKVPPLMSGLGRRADIACQELSGPLVAEAVEEGPTYRRRETMESRWRRF
jgi:hypothetical protein